MAEFLGTSYIGTAATNFKPNFTIGMQLVGLVKDENGCASRPRSGPLARPGARPRRGGHSCAPARRHSRWSLFSGRPTSARTGYRAGAWRVPHDRPQRAAAVAG